MTIDNKQADPPVRNSMFVQILLSVIGVLLIGFVTVVYSQIQTDRKEQADVIKEQAAKNAAQEVRIVQLETAFYYIKTSLDKIESTTKTTAEKVATLERKIGR
jgi:uncharacterized protein HemX